MSLTLTLISLILWTGLGSVLAWKRLVNGAHLHFLNKLILNLLLPLYIFITTTQHFEYDFFIHNGTIFFAQGLFVLLGGLITVLLFGKINRKYYVNLLAFQNCGYLPIPIILTFQNHGKILFLLFLLLAGFNAMLFSLGYWILNHKQNWREILNAPLIATLLALIVCLLAHFWPTLIPVFPKEIIAPYHAIGFILQAFLIPLILVVFGGSLIQNLSSAKPINLMTHVRLSLAKYLIIPGITFLLFYHASNEVFLLMMIQSFMPPAMNLLFMPEKASDVQTMTGYLAFQYGVFLVVGIPLFIIYKLFC